MDVYKDQFTIVYMNESLCEMIKYNTTFMVFDIVNTYNTVACEIIGTCKLFDIFDM